MEKSHSSENLGRHLAETFSSSEQSPINALSNELLCQIFSLLNSKDLNTLALLNKQWKDVSSCDSLWRPLCHSELPEKYQTLPGQLIKDHFIKSKMALNDQLKPGLETIKSISDHFRNGLQTMRSICIDHDDSKPLSDLEVEVMERCRSLITFLSDPYRTGKEKEKALSDFLNRSIVISMVTEFLKDNEENQAWENALRAGLNLRRDASGSLIYHAVKKNDFEKAKLLLDFGADPNQGSLLNQAASKGNHRMVELLLNYKVDPYVAHLALLQAAERILKDEQVQEKLNVDLILGLILCVNHLDKYTEECKCVKSMDVQHVREKLPSLRNIGKPLTESCSNHEQSAIDVLPDELLYQIFSLLNPKDLNTLALVNKRWRDVSLSDAQWRPLCRAELPEKYRALPDQLLKDHFIQTKKQLNEQFENALKTITAIFYYFGDLKEHCRSLITTLSNPYITGKDKEIALLTFFEFFKDSRITQLLIGNDDNLILEYALKAGLNPNSLLDGGHCPEPLLFPAVRKHDIEKVRLLLKFGADPNVETNSFKPLTLAASRGYHEIVKLFLEKGVDSLTANLALEAATQASPIKNKILTINYLIEYIAKDNMNENLNQNIDEKEVEERDQGEQEKEINEKEDVSDVPSLTTNESNETLLSEKELKPLQKSKKEKKQKRCIIN